MIRERAEGDTEDIVDIWVKASAIAYTFLTNSYLIQLTEDMRTIYIPQTTTYVYEKQGKPVAFISMIENEIGGLFVHPDYHRMGIASKLVNHVKAQFPKLEVEVFEKNELGRAFYHKYGFQFMHSYLHKESNEQMLRLTL